MTHNLVLAQLAHKILVPIGSYSICVNWKSNRGRVLFDVISYATRGRHKSISKSTRPPKLTHNPPGAARMAPATRDGVWGLTRPPDPLHGGNSSLISGTVLRGDLDLGHDLEGDL